VRDDAALAEAVTAYLAAWDAEPEKDCWDTETGEEEPGAQKFASDWSWADRNDAVLAAREKLRKALASLPAPAGDVPGEAQAQEAWQPIADLKPQTNAVLGRWARSGDNEDGSEFWYWQEATGRWFEHAGEVHWCLRSGRFDHGPFYGEAPTHFHVIPEKPARVEAQTQEGKL
jgi:hypothetical protein